MEIPFYESWLVDTALVVLLIIFVFFIYFLFHRSLDWIRKEKKYSEEGCFGCLLKFLVLTFLILGAINFLAFAAYIQTFHSFAYDQLIAEIICEEDPYEPQKLNIDLTFTHNQKTIHTKLIGDLWQIKGEILTFRPFITIFGIKPMYRINYLTAKYESNTEQTKIANNIYSFLNYENNKNWSWFYNLGSNFPVIRRITEVSIAKPPYPGSKYNIAVTPQTFLADPQYIGNIND